MFIDPRRSFAAVVAALAIGLTLAALAAHRDASTRTLAPLLQPRN